jgi:hypothetical protein
MEAEKKPGSGRGLSRLFEGTAGRHRSATAGISIANQKFDEVWWRWRNAEAEHRLSIAEVRADISIGKMGRRRLAGGRPGPSGRAAARRPGRTPFTARISKAEKLQAAIGRRQNLTYWKD